MTNDLVVSAELLRNAQRALKSNVAKKKTAGPDVMTAAEFLMNEPGSIEWIVPTILPRGGFTIVYGAPKIGKTTFIAHLVASILWGRPFLNGVTRLESRVLWLDLEQPRRVSHRRFFEVGAAGREDLIIYRGQGPETDQLSRLIDEWGVGMVIADSLSRMLLLENENDNSEVTRRLEPVLRALQDRDVTFLANHHDRKSEGDTGRTMRGASSLLAAVDIAVEMKAEGPMALGRRRLCFTSREEPTDDRLIRLDDGYYVLEGSRDAATLDEHERAIIAAVKLGATTKKALAEALGVTTKTVERWVAPLLNRGRLLQHTQPKRGAPVEYRLEADAGHSETILEMSESRK